MIEEKVNSDTIIYGEDLQCAGYFFKYKLIILNSLPRRKS